MLPYSLVGGVVLLGYLVYRHLSGRRAPILISVVVIALLAGGFSLMRTHTAERRYSDAAKKMLKRADVHVDCQSLTGALLDVFGYGGYVPYKNDGSLPTDAKLMWDTCRDLGHWTNDRGTHDRDQIIAVHVLTHETMHLGGEYNEANAECFAIQHDSQMAQILGATPTQGDTLAETYWREVYPHMRDDYRTSECVPGGALDIHPDTPEWPTG